MSIRTLYITTGFPQRITYVRTYVRTYTHTQTYIYIISWFNHVFNNA